MLPRPSSASYFPFFCRASSISFNSRVFTNMARFIAASLVMGVAPTMASNIRASFDGNAVQSTLAWVERNPIEYREPTSKELETLVREPACSMNLNSSANFSAMASMSSNDIKTKESRRRHEMFNNANWDNHWLITVRKQAQIDTRCQQVWQACHRVLYTFERAAGSVVYDRTEELAEWDKVTVEEKEKCKRAAMDVIDLNGFGDYDRESGKTCRMGSRTHAHFYEMYSRSARGVQLCL